MPEETRERMTEKSLEASHAKGRGNLEEQVVSTWLRCHDNHKEQKLNRRGRLLELSGWGAEGKMDLLDSSICGEKRQAKQLAIGANESISVRLHRETCTGQEAFCGCPERRWRGRQMSSRVKMCSQTSKDRKSLCFLKLGKLLPIPSDGDARPSLHPSCSHGRKTK